MLGAQNHGAGAPRSPTSAPAGGRRAAPLEAPDQRRERPVPARQETLAQRLEPFHVRVPPAQIDGDEPNPSLDEPAGEEDALAPRRAAAAVGRFRIERWREAVALADR